MMALSDTMIEQIYLAPAWIGRGLDLYCFHVSARARAFYEAHGFTAIAFGDGSGNEERQPDIRYAWRS